MSDDTEKKKDSKQKSQSDALGKKREKREFGKELTGGRIRKGKTAESSDGEEGGYGFIRPSARTSNSKKESKDSNSEE